MLRCKHFRFSLRTLLLIVAVAGFLLGYLGWEIRRAECKRRAISDLLHNSHYSWIFEFGSEGFAHDLSIPRTNVLHNKVSDYLFVEVHTICVDFGYDQDPQSIQAADDALIKIAADFPKLKRLDVRGEVSERGLLALSQLKHLRSLELSCPQVNDNVMRQLSELKQLEQLWLFRPRRITDDGIAELKKFPQLKDFLLSCHRQQTPPGLTRESLVHLKALRNLEMLCFTDDEEWWDELDRTRHGHRKQLR